MGQKIAVGITGASGSIYAKELLTSLWELSHLVDCCDVVLSANAADVWKHELGTDPTLHIKQRIFHNNDFFAPFASGSSAYDALVICPCSMGTIGRVASGISDTLITRAADVMLKERKKLILVARETPYNTIHLRNMLALSEAGAIICPATPSFYTMPQNIDELVHTVCGRVLQLMDLPSGIKKWGE